MLPLLVLPLVTAGCTPPCADGFGRDSEGNCVPYRSPGDTGVDTPDDTGGDTATDTGTVTDTEPVETLDLAYGDPILATGRESTEPDGPIYEFVDVVLLDDDHAAAVGEGGYVLVNVADGSHVWREGGPRVYDAAWDATLERLYLGSREREVYAVDLTDLQSPVQAGAVQAWSGYHEDLAADGGVLAVAALGDGAVLLDGVTLAPLATIEVGWCAAVGLAGDRAIVADGAEVLLYDVSDPAAPVELSRASVRATARNIDFDGEHVGVALGGHGVAVLEVEDDTLSLAGEFEQPGSTYGVALDGEYLWTSAWSEVGLIWLGKGGPVVVGTEPIEENTMGIGAGGGRAVAADWFQTAAFERVDGVAGPELQVPGTAWVIGDDPPTAIVEVTNLGAMDLEVDFSTEDTSLELDTDSLLIEPGGSERLVITGETGHPLSSVVEYVSNDPDEESGQLEVRTGEQSVGQAHTDFELEGFVPPDTNLEPYALSGQSGRVTVLAYFALY